MVKRIGTKGKRLRLILLNLLILTIDDFLKTTMKRVNLRLSVLDNPYWASLSVSVIRIEVRKDLREVTVGSSVWMNIKTPASYSCIQIYFQTDIQTIQKHLKEDSVVYLN